MSEVRLRTVAEVRPSNVDKKSVEGQTPVQLCNYTDVYKNDYLTTAIKFMSATASSSQIEAFALQRGDVLITKDSETPNDIATPALVTEDLFGTLCGYHLALIRPDPTRVDPRFLFRALSIRHVNRQFEVGATGVTRYGLRTDVIKDARVPLPKLQAQRLIAGFLDRETHLIDSLVEAKKMLIGLLAEKRTAMITHAVTKGLDPSAPMKESEIAWVGEMPRHWDVRRLGHIARVLGGTGFPEALQGLSNEELPFYKVSDMTAEGNEEHLQDAANSVSYETAHSLRGTVIPAGAVVFPKVGAALLTNKRRLTSRSCLIDNNCMALWFQVGRAEYWVNLFKAIDFEWIVQPGPVPSINGQQVKELRVPFPPEAEQRLIVDRLTRKGRTIDAALDAVNRQLNLLAEYRQALITAAVTGQLDEATLKGEKPVAEALEMEVPS